MASSDFSASSNSSSYSSDYSSASAPLPSPSSSQPAQYFTSQPSLHHHQLRYVNSTSQTQSQATTSQPQSQPQQQLQQVQQQAPQRDAREPYGGIQAQEGCLIAEAAKKAQVAILMRDMAELSL